MRIALIGLGEVGKTLAADLNGHEIAAYDLQFSDPGSGPSRAGVPVRRTASSAEAAKAAQVVISVVTAAQALEAARAAAPGLSEGAIFLDLNSCSPGQKIACAEAVNGAGGRYVEASVMAPIGPKRIASPILLGGPHAKGALPVIASLGFSGAKVFSDEYGKASAAKLCRSVMIKGIEALLAESLLSARRYGVEDHVLSSLSDLLPVGDWEALARYMIERSVEHGGRRAEEMEEAARTVEEAGVEPMMSRAAARRQAFAARHRTALGAEGLAGLLDAISGEPR